MDSVNFVAEYCGELGAGKLAGEALDDFKEKLKYQIRNIR